MFSSQGIRPCRQVHSFAGGGPAGAPPPEHGGGLEDSLRGRLPFPVCELRRTAHKVLPTWVLAGGRRPSPALSWGPSLAPALQPGLPAASARAHGLKAGSSAGRHGPPATPYRPASEAARARGAFLTGPFAQLWLWGQDARSTAPCPAGRPTLPVAGPGCSAAPRSDSHLIRTRSCTARLCCRHARGPARPPHRRRALCRQLHSFAGGGPAGRGHSGSRDEGSLLRASLWVRTGLLTQPTPPRGRRPGGRDSSGLCACPGRPAASGSGRWVDTGPARPPWRARGSFSPGAPLSGRGPCAYSRHTPADGS